MDTLSATQIDSAQFLLWLTNLIRSLQMRMTSKLTVISAFSMRLLYVSPCDRCITSAD